MDGNIKDDSPIRPELKQLLDQGVPPHKVSFELGFRACMESVRDKGCHKLADALELEYDLLRDMP